MEEEVLSDMARDEVAIDQFLAQYSKAWTTRPMSVLRDVTRRLLIGEKQLAQLRAAAPRWIPFNEKKPFFGVRVLVRMGNEYQVIASLFAGGWKNDSGQGIKNVTHWMPLPEPPRP